MDPQVERIRTVCMALPEVSEKLSHGEPTWFVRKRAFANMAIRHHDDRVAVWCAAPEGVQEAMVAANPERAFRPPYVGVRGWVGLYLDVEVDWDEVQRSLELAHGFIREKSRARR